MPAYCYHRIATPSPSYPYHRLTIDATPEQFEAQLRSMKLDGEVLSPEEYRDHVLGGTLPERATLVTFDDGYRDNHDVALPLLQAHNVKALFFIATVFISYRRLFWWDLFAAAYPSRYPELIEMAKSTPNVGVLKGLVLKGLDGHQRWELTYDAVDELVMSWDHVRALHAAGMTIGSHTLSHRNLSVLSAEEVGGELRRSQVLIGRQVGAEPWGVAYPFGPTPTPQVIEAASQCYQLGFTYRAPPSAHPMLLPRLPPPSNP